MTKKATRFLIIVLVAATVFSLAIYGLGQLAKNTYTYAEVSYNTSGLHGTGTSVTGEDDVTALSSAIKNADYAKDVVISDTKAPQFYLTTHAKSGDTTTYGVYIESIFKRIAYLKRLSDGRITKLAPTDFTELFSMDHFAVALDNTTPMDAYLISTQTDEVTSRAVIGYPYSGAWNYAAADGKQLTLNIEGEDKDEYSLIESNALPFTLKMDSYPTDLMTLVIYEDGEEMLRLLTDGNDIPNPGRDGFFVYEITATWPTVADVDFNGTVTYRFYVNIDLEPSPEFSQTSAPQGSVVTVKAVNGDKDDSVTAYCDELEFKGTFTPVNGVPTALMPIPLSAKAGEYQITFEINGVTHTEAFTVTDGTFKSQQLTISTVVPQSWRDEQETYLTPLREYASAQNYINGAFTEPATGKITTYFGTFRYTNGALEPTRHNGIDIANRNMPDVICPMDGMVVFTMNMKYTGKTVVVDHGMNVLSYFYHLNTIDVDEGDILSTGDIIGQMGTTGYSTGVHLHYTVMVNGHAVDPNVFYATDFSK